MLKGTPLWRSYAADILAMISFSTIVGFLIETTLGGLSIDQSLISRAGAVPLNLITSIPYSRFRDFLLNWLRRSSHHARGLSLAADSIAFLAFQTPLYLVIVSAAGVQFATAIRSASIIAIAALISGRPYGIYLEWIRFNLGAGK